MRATYSTTPPAAPTLAPTLTLAGDNQIDVDELYTLSLASTDPGEDTITQWTINWGDGTPGSIETIFGNPSDVTHTYTTAGDYTITATATALGTATARVGSILALDPHPHPTCRRSATFHRHTQHGPTRRTSQSRMGMQQARS